MIIKSLNKSILGIFLLTLTQCLISGCNPKKEDSRLNIILFYIDDLGSKDLGCYGSPLYKTPTIDSLAQAGISYTNAYSACTVCSPSRAALITGKYPARLHLTDWISGWNFPYAKLSVPDWTKYLALEEETVAERLKTRGYQTWHVGKWHLGHDSLYWPENQGFDINIAGNFKGAPNRQQDGYCDGYFSPYCLDRIADGPKGEYLTDRLTDEAVSLIESAGEQPFFLNLSHYAVHTPIQAKRGLIEKFDSLVNDSMIHRRADYAAMIYSVDQSVKRVIQALREAQKLDRSLILFSSDNGAVHKISPASPLRKGKGHHYEGGVRVPLIAYWPGKLEGGGQVTTPQITMDITATILNAAGYGESTYQDGRSLLNPNDERPIFWHYPHYHRQGGRPHSAVRLGDWKLLHLLEDDRFELYNLSMDPGETDNRVDHEKEKYNELKTILENWKTRVNAQQPMINELHDPRKSHEIGPYIE